MAGAISNENEWKAKVAKLEKEFAESQVQTEKVNTEVITKYVTKREVVYQKAEEQIRYIDREIVKYNDICKLPSEVIKIHNEAAKAPK
jgi:molybdopterin-binding protein